VGGAPITPDNLAVPGEIIYIYVAGIGPVTSPDGTSVGATAGQIHNGPIFNTPVTTVDNAQVGGRSANVLFASLVPGQLRRL
jgi:uncharacterized protein (TIGR03437 family)